MRIEVEPQELIGAGKQVGSLGTQLGALSDAMSQVLSGGIASGTDAAGLNFGISYGRQADDFGQYLAQLANSFKSVGLMLEATGINYQHSDQASTAGGSGPTGAVSGEQAETKAGDAPYAPVMSLVPPPPNWWLIQPLLNMIPLFGIAMTWPTGDSGMMNVTAAQWTNIGRGLKVFEPALQAASMAAGAQDIPEVGQITQALKDIGEGATKLAAVADGIGTAITDFARGVQETQDSIRRLLDRISLGGIWDSLTGMISGEGGNILREIANDVGNVLENFQNQVQGVLGLLSELQTLLGEAADAFQKWMRPVLVGIFGEEHGNFLADGIKLYTDIQVGAGIGLIGLVSGTVALADPATWQGLADTALMIAKDPTMLDDVLLEAGGEFIAYDEITGDNPGRGIGEAGFNIASLFIPGGAFAKGGSVAKGLNFTRNLLEKGDLGPLGRLPGLGGHRTPDMPELPDTPGAPHVPEFTPPAGIPGSVLNPSGAGPGSPSTPASPSAPGSSNGNAPVRPQGGDPGGPSPTRPSPNGSPDGGAGPGSPSSGGPAPTGGSPGPSGGDAPSGGSQSSPSVSSPSESPGPSGPSKGGDDGPGISSNGGGSSSGGGSSGGGDGPGDSSSVGSGSRPNDDSPDGGSPSGSSNDGSDTGMTQNSDDAVTPDDRSADAGRDHPSDEPGAEQSEYDSAEPDYSDTNGVPLSREQFDEIVATEKGQRPPPDTYLPPEYIADHLNNFQDGASRILIRSDFEEYGVGKPDPGKSEFVLTKEDADAIMAEAGGDPVKVAQKLGIPEDQLAGDSIVIIDFHPDGSYEPLMPSGNEWGANKQWIPGGRLPEGDLEAVVLTDGMIKGRDYTVRDIGTGEIL